MVVSIFAAVRFLLALAAVSVSLLLALVLAAFHSMNTKLLAAHLVAAVFAVTSGTSHVPVSVLVAVFALVLLQSSLEGLMFEVLALLIGLAGFLHVRWSASDAANRW